MSWLASIAIILKADAATHLDIIASTCHEITNRTPSADELKYWMERIRNSGETYADVIDVHRKWTSYMRSFTSKTGNLVLRRFSALFQLVADIVIRVGTKFLKHRGKVIGQKGQGLNQAQIDAMKKQRQIMWNATGGGVVYR